MDFKWLAEMKNTKLISIISFLFGTMFPGLLIIYEKNKSMFLDMNIVKLILLSFSITLPYFLIIMIVFILFNTFHICNIIHSIDNGIEILTILSGIASGLILYLALFLVVFFNAKKMSSIKQLLFAVIGSTIIMIIIAGLTRFYKKYNVKQ